MKHSVAYGIDKFQSTLPVGGSDQLFSGSSDFAGQFQSTLPVGGERQSVSGWVRPREDFNPRSPWGGATLSSRSSWMSVRISIHAPRGGERLPQTKEKVSPRLFQSTLPVGGSDYSGARNTPSSELFQSTLPVGGSDLRSTEYTIFGAISIHAPRGGERLQGVDRSVVPTSISIHAPRGGERLRRSSPGQEPEYFNPRSPWGGATTAYELARMPQDISIHAPRGGERHLHPTKVQIPWISIHAPRGGERPSRKSITVDINIFQSTLPVGGATRIFSK